MTSVVHSDYSIETLLTVSVPRHMEASQSTSRYRRARTVFSLEAVKYMEQEFERGKYPDVRRRKAIAAKIGVSESRIQVWFQNRRARNNKRRHSDHTCSDVTKNNTAKRRCVVQGAEKKQDFETLKRCPQVRPAVSPCYAAMCHPMYGQVCAVYPTPYNQSFVLPSLLNLSNLSSPCQQTNENETEADDFVKRMFRFSARDGNTVKEHQANDKQQMKTVRMVVPTKKVIDCSVNELRTGESRELENEDSCLVNDSISDTL